MWGRTAKSIMTVQERHLETADYERKMYSRPDAIIVRLNKAASMNQANVSIGFNVKSLAHQAITQLRNGTPGLKLCVRWSLQTGLAQPVVLSLPKFHHVLSKNGDVAMHDPLEGVGFSLYPFQLESLT